MPQDFFQREGQRHLSIRKSPSQSAKTLLVEASAKKKAAAKDALLCSMDDETLYGAEVYRIDFVEAVKKHLLSNYKFIVLTIGNDQIPPTLHNLKGAIYV